VRTLTVSVRNGRHEHVSEVTYDTKFKWKSQQIYIVFTARISLVSDPMGIWKGHVHLLKKVHVRGFPTYGRVQHNSCTSAQGLYITLYMRMVETYSTGALHRIRINLHSLLDNYNFLNLPDSIYRK